MRTLGLPLLGALAAVPVACTLDAQSGRERAASWAALTRRGSPSVHSAPDRVTLTYTTNLPHVEPELSRLVSLERTCCAFLHFEVERQADSVVLRITRPGATAASQPVGNLAAIFLG